MKNAPSQSPPLRRWSACAPVPSVTSPSPAKTPSGIVSRMMPRASSSPGGGGGGGRWGGGVRGGRRAERGPRAGPAGGHREREARHQERTPHERRVEEIEAEAAEDRLADRDREHPGARGAC